MAVVDEKGDGGRKDARIICVEKIYPVFKYLMENGYSPFAELRTKVSLPAHETLQFGRKSGAKMVTRVGRDAYKIFLLREEISLSFTNLVSEKFLTRWRARF